jgi:hypothetical protein
LLKDSRGSEAVNGTYDGVEGSKLRRGWEEEKGSPMDAKARCVEEMIRGETPKRGDVGDFSLGVDFESPDRSVDI